MFFYIFNFLWKNTSYFRIFFRSFVGSINSVCNGIIWTVRQLVSPTTYSLVSFIVCFDHASFLKSYWFLQINSGRLYWTSYFSIPLFIKANISLTVICLSFEFLRERDRRHKFRKYNCWTVIPRYCWRTEKNSVFRIVVETLPKIYGSVYQEARWRQNEEETRRFQKWFPFQAFQALRPQTINESRC